MRVEIERSTLRLYVDPAIEARHVLDVAERATPVFEASGDQVGLLRAWVLVADAHWCSLAVRDDGGRPRAGARLREAGG